MTLSAREAEMIGWLESQYDAMVELLRRLVDTDSGSYDRDGVARAGSRRASRVCASSPSSAARSPNSMPAEFRRVGA